MQLNGSVGMYFCAEICRYNCFCSLIRTLQCWHSVNQAAIDKDHTHSLEFYYIGYCPFGQQPKSSSQASQCIGILKALKIMHEEVKDAFGCQVTMI